MIELPPDRSTIRPWVVCESGHRWLNAVHRFAPDLMPVPLQAVTTSCQRSQSSALLSGHDRAIVLWEVDRSNLAATCDSLTRTAILFPRILQLLAGSGLSGREWILLQEFPAATTLRQPEQLPALATMIHAYFATSG